MSNKKVLDFGLAVAPPNAKKSSAKNLAKCALMYSQGASKRDIAAEVGVAPATIAVWLNKPEVQEAVGLERERNLERSRIQMENAAERAIRALVEVADTAQYERDRVAAATALLDRIGLAKREQLDLKVDHGDQDVSSLVQAALPTILETLGPEKVIEAASVQMRITGRTVVPQDVDEDED